MEMLIARGADLQTRDSQGRSAVVLPVTTGNWKVLRLLLERGAPWRDQKGPGGVPLVDYVEGQTSSDPDDGRLAVLAILRAQPTGQRTP